MRSVAGSKQGKERENKMLRQLRGGNQEHCFGELNMKFCALGSDQELSIVPEILRTEEGNLVIILLRVPKCSNQYVSE